MQIDLMQMIRMVVWCNKVNVTIIQTGYDEIQDFDLGLRRLLFQKDSKKKFLEIFDKIGIQEHHIYFIKDSFEVEYCLISLPDTERKMGDFILLGPYRKEPMQQINIHALMIEKDIEELYFTELLEYYNAVPVLMDMGYWEELCINISRIFFPDSGIIQVKYVYLEELNQELLTEETVDVLSFRMIEERYEAESGMMAAIANGNQEEAIICLHNMEKYKLEHRYQDRVRDIRNLLIVFNSLCRKAAQQGCVHPAYIDKLSSECAKKIETVVTEKQGNRMRRELVRKYCLLVCNYSLKGCTPIIQKVANHINLNLTDDLSLKMLAAEYSVNASYLSTIFKKEMDISLTGYITRQRIKRATLIINSTTLSIQEVAARCGIYDAHYFSRLFKKTTGITPTEYIKQVRVKI